MKEEYAIRTDQKCKAKLEIVKLMLRNFIPLILILFGRSLGMVHEISLG